MDHTSCITIMTIKCLRYRNHVYIRMKNFILWLETEMELPSCYICEAVFNLCLNGQVCSCLGNCCQAKVMKIHSHITNWMSHIRHNLDRGCSKVKQLSSRTNTVKKANSAQLCVCVCVCACVCGVLHVSMCVHAYVYERECDKIHLY